MPGAVPVRPFTIAVDEDVLRDLRDRIQRTRWPDQVTGTGWDYGTDLCYLRDLLASWHDFDWAAQQRRLNSAAHFRAEVGGLGVHLVHERGRGPAPFPLLLTHGWPSSFTEYGRLIPLLTDPGSHGADPGDAFDVVVPSLPGYGFSDRPAAPGLVFPGIAGRWHRLMTEGLGYRRFGAHGTDIGAGVTARLGLQYPQAVAGVHLSSVGLPEPPEPWSAAEREYVAAVRRWFAEEGGYEHLQATRPQTAGYGLADSPAGLAAWIIEKFRAWSDSGGDVESRFSREQLLTNLTVYWVTGTITSSMRLYYEYGRYDTPLSPASPVRVPAGFAIFGHEFRPFGQPPRELAERFFPRITRWAELPRGGHFPAAEEPELLAGELREFFRPLR